MSCNVSYYYASLSAAITDLNVGSFTNNLPDSSTAKVGVDQRCDGMYAVRLLDNIAESNSITINQDVVLELNGKIVSFSDAVSHLIFGAGTNCVIDGDGGSIIKEVNGEVAGVAYLINTDGDSLLVKGGSYRCQCNTSDQVLVFRAGGDCERFALENCVVTSENGVGQAICIQSQAIETDVVNCTVTANGKSIAYGVFTKGQASIQSSTVDTNSVDQYSIAVRNMGGNMEIMDSKVLSAAENSYAYALHNMGGNCKASNVDFTVTSDSSNAIGINLQVGSAEVTDCTISAVTYGEMQAIAWGIISDHDTTLNVKNGSVTVDAGPNNDTTKLKGIAIDNRGIAFLENVLAIGTYTAVYNYGKLYVSGGEYKSYTYGGFVLTHGAEGEAFINDAVLRGGFYDGDFDYKGYQSTSTLYLINAYTKAYMDGCTCDATKCHRSIVIRGEPGELHNSLYISNSTVDDGTLNAGAIRLDNNTMMLHVGVGTNIDATKYKNGFTVHGEDGVRQVPADYEAEGVVEYTNQLYRRVPDGHICNGKDFGAMAQWGEGIAEETVTGVMAAEVVTTEETATITQTFNRPENGRVEVAVYIPPVSGDAVTSKGSFMIGEETVFQGFLMSDSANSGSVLVEYHIRKDAPCNPVHYFTNGAGLAPLHSNGLVTATVADSVTVTAPAGANFPVGTRLYLSVCAL